MYVANIGNPAPARDRAIELAAIADAELNRKLPLAWPYRSKCGSFQRQTKHTSGGRRLVDNFGLVK